jgi:hypothetical protein
MLRAPKLVIMVVVLQVANLETMVPLNQLVMSRDTLLGTTPMVESVTQRDTGIKTWRYCWNR